MLHVFPAELVLETLSYLPVQALRALQLTCRAWREFIRANEGLIYHKAAVLHRFVPSESASSSTEWDLQHTKSKFAQRFVRDAENWKGFCRDRFQLEKNWMGWGPSAIRDVHPAGSWVHRIKVDEAEGFVITTYAVGGLTVSDINEGGILWSLEASYVRPYAHCEYSNGFLVFDQLGGFKEVWCLSSRHAPSTYPQYSFPDDRQEIASQRAAHRYGHAFFRPWALLQMPSVTCAFRFVWPTLLVASQKEAYLFDVQSAALVQTVDISEPTPHGIREMNYVELSETHVFICWRQQICVFSRKEGQLVLNIDRSDTLDTGMLLQVDAYRPPASTKVPNAVMTPLNVSKYTGSVLPYRQTEEFTAVHVSADGRDLAILGDPETVFFIRDFQSIVQKKTTLAASSARLDFTSRFGHSLYHAFENGKVGLVMCSGIYVVTLDATRHGVNSPTSQRTRSCDSTCAFPHVSICRAMGFDDPGLLSQIDCLQMTDTGIYFVWEASRIPRLSSMVPREGRGGINNYIGTGEEMGDAEELDGAGEVDTELDEDEVLVVHDAPVPQSPILTYIDFAVRPLSCV